jgi:hypothetical protein
MDIKVQKGGSISTVAVIVMVNGNIDLFKSFPDTAEGNKKARDLFNNEVNKASNNDPELHLKSPVDSREEYHNECEEGEDEIDIFITHSTEGE